MKRIDRFAINDFELAVMDLAEALEVKSKEDLEWLSCTLHEHLEIAVEDYAMDEGIEDYEAQY